MTAIPKLVKCKNCGHTYNVLTGGLINKTTPSNCPKCGRTKQLSQMWQKKLTDR